MQKFSVNKRKAPQTYCGEEKQQRGFNRGDAQNLS